MPEFLQNQLNEDRVDLDALAARVSIDLQLQPTLGKRGTYLLIGKPRHLIQTTFALPATKVAGVRKRGRKWSPWRQMRPIQRNTPPGEPSRTGPHW
jgi:hypothetical protein